jgi:hypothetical protein
MTVQITQPELDALVEQRPQSGALRTPRMSSCKRFSSSQLKPAQPENPPAKDIVELLAPLLG